jgi:hypothetical protein
MVDSKVAAKKARQTSTSAETPAATGTPAGKGPQSAEELHQLTAVAAYYLAERRNFEPGHEMEDWLIAEAQIRAEVTTAPNHSHRASPRS